MNPRLPLLAAGLYGAAGSAAGAFGAHALRAFLLSRGYLETWETAVRYQLVHAVALLALAAWARSEPAPVASRRVRWAALCWCLGIPLFSGSLYGLAAGAPRWVGAVTPFGGLSLIAGWLWLAAAAWASGAPASRLPDGG